MTISKTTEQAFVSLKEKVIVRRTRKEREVIGLTGLDIHSQGWANIIGGHRKILKRNWLFICRGCGRSWKPRRTYKLT